MTEKKQLAPRASSIRFVGSMSSHALLLGLLVIVSYLPVLEAG